MQIKQFLLQQKHRLKLLTMQQTLTALDATGSKRVELQKEREAKRRTQLEQAIDGTAYTPADLAQVLEAIVHGEGSSAPLKLADANRGDEEAEEEVALKEVAAPSSAAAASLCTTCLERYLGARDLAALLLTPGPHLSTLGLAVTEEAEGASQAARYQAAEKLFNCSLCDVLVEQLHYEVHMCVCVCAFQSWPGIQLAEVHAAPRFPA